MTTTTTVARGIRAVGRGLRESLLTLAAIGGAICILLVILVYTGGYSLIMFKTGSMTPTIPAGSVALVQRIPASEIVVGDIVTVARDDALPITHRVTGVAHGAAHDERVIMMKGDANEAEDPAPYTVDEVRIVRGSVPGVASVIVWFGDPRVLGALTIGASALVVWAFWPRTDGDTPSSASETPTTSEQDAAAEPRSGGELAGAGALRRDRRT